MTAIPRDDVHRLSEACADAGDDFRNVATRLVREQKPLTNFLSENLAAVDPQSGEVALYMYSVILRIFDQWGGRMSKVRRRAARAAGQKVRDNAEALLPFDDGLPERARAVEDRAQPHILDEVLWALYEREDDEKVEGEVDVDPEQAALIYLALWAVVEALDEAWKPPGPRG